MLKEYYYDDKVLGRIRIVRSKKAKRTSIRITGDADVVLTIPYRQSEDESLDFFRSKYDWILSHRNKVKKTVVTKFDDSTEFSTLTFRVKIQKGLSSVFKISLSGGLLTITYPDAINLDLESSQDVIRMGIEKAMRMEAQRILPHRLRSLAEKFGFKFSGVTIRSSKTRWGSCSSLGNINLSYFLMTLPPYLIDYVLLHELCHTKEMNHGPRFWALMDKVTAMKSDEYRSDIKKYKTSF
ncbi:MAG TPA: SprT family zinc-dependent metalloprotease [Paludibacteraceae bacterium]|nr:SprT family zinc-dependent metalloprotease [Paludibacteraceae bacterium]